METSSNPVPFVCPCCHKKTTGYQRKDGAILVLCHRCKAKIFSKQHNKESIDKQASGGNTVTEVNYAVNKQYAFGSINGKPYVNCVDIETIVVTDKFVGFVRYKDGFKLYVGACDSHFVAFNTDRPIDKLLEADVYYTTQSYDWSSVPFVGVKETFGDKADKYAYLKYTDKVEHTGGGLFAGTYKWDRIQTIDDFIKGENRENIYHGAVLDVKTSSKLTDEALTELKGKKWVLRFAETSYSLSGYSTTGSTFESSMPSYLKLSP